MVLAIFGVFVYQKGSVIVASHVHLLRQWVDRQTGYHDVLLNKTDQQHFFIPKTVNDSQFTLVMLTHNRTDIMLKTIQNYAQMKTIHKIILLWNNIGTPAPNISDMVNLSMPLVVKTLKENKLRLRFLPLPEIETQGMGL